LPQGTVELLIGRARVVPSHTPDKSGTFGGAAGSCARTLGIAPLTTSVASTASAARQDFMGVTSIGVARVF
jgi:hypothetical protein